MKSSSVWIIFTAAVLTRASEGHYYTPLGAAFDQQEDYFISDPYYPLDAGWYPSQQLRSPLWDIFQPSKTQYMNYEAQPNSLINYIPVHPGSWITPNVYVKGRGYSTDRYVAPTMLEKYLAMNPR